MNLFSSRLCCSSAHHVISILELSAQMCSQCDNEPLMTKIIFWYPHQLSIYAAGLFPLPLPFQCSSRWKSPVCAAVPHCEAYFSPFAVWSQVMLHFTISPSSSWQITHLLVFTGLPDIWAGDSLWLWAQGIPNTCWGEDKKGERPSLSSVDRGAVLKTIREREVGWCEEKTKGVKCGI